MDYEKKYNEALERAKNIKSKILQSHLSTESCKAVSEYIDEIIPELHESEDERIRKWIIEEFKIHYDFESPSLNPMVEKALAWLEKQKEISENKAYEILSKKGFVIIERELYNELCDKAEQEDQKFIEDVVKNITKNKEAATKFLKSAGIMDENGELAEMYRSEQKPVNYDHEMWKNCEANFEGGKKEVIEHPERYGLQKSAEWSEEDERIVGRIQMILEFFDRNYPADMNIGSEVPKYISWLKSLRPSWKPSEEQIEALRIAAYEPHKNWNEKLQELYEQLKKLKP